MSVVEASNTIIPILVPICQWCKSETIFQSFVCNSISVFKFGLLHGIKCFLTYVCASKHRVHFCVKCYILGNLLLLTNFQMLSTVWSNAVKILYIKIKKNNMIVLTKIIYCNTHKIVNTVKAIRS